MLKTGKLNIFVFGGLSRLYVTLTWFPNLFLNESKLLNLQLI